MTTPDALLEKFVAAAEALPLPAWKEIVARGQKAAGALRTADEDIAEALAEASVALARSKETPAAREARQAEVWRINNRIEAAGSPV